MIEQLAVQHHLNAKLQGRLSRRTSSANITPPFNKGVY